MNLAWILALSVALGADAFSLALAIGLVGVGKRMTLRLSLLVAIFHVFMPLGGLFLGQTLGMFLGHLARGIGSLVLLWLGGRMIFHVWRPEAEYIPLSEARPALNRKQLPTGVSLSGIGMYALAASVSLDALSVGFSLGTVDSRIGLTVLVMGTVAGIMMGSGLVLGRYVGSWLGKRAEVVGGFVLVIIGLRMLLG
ncbi:manganese efflux pump MntP family protein [Desulfitobacterium sp. PCE1]|uniref:manganese efflux pump MntP n=1 Tax=Desulfitobacterium sp. PCE1 TaxID=146907 RepID=UPI00036FF1C6|nr:manganese efflux pump MntP family protein [Desulfitobacterium sp. PCE1]